MVHAHWISGVLLALLLTGCTTSTVLTNPRAPDIVLTSAGELLYHDKTITLQQLPERLRADRVKREEIIQILIPANQAARDYITMRSLTDTLKRAGYGRVAFTTEKKAVSIVKPSPPGRP